jgi:hypothetical protein
MAVPLYGLFDQSAGFEVDEVERLLGVRTDWTFWGAGIVESVVCEDFEDG